MAACAATHKQDRGVILIGHLRVSQLSLLVSHFDPEACLHRLLLLADRLRHVELIRLVSPIDKERHHSRGSLRPILGEHLHLYFN